MFKIKLTLFILLFSLKLFVYCHNEFIAFDSEDEIVLINTNGEIKKKIKLPYKIIYDFCLKGDYVCFMGDDRKLHLLNWKTNMEVKLPAGPFIDSNKSKILDGIEYIFGPEIYHNIDFSLKNKMISCIVTPEFSKSKGNETEEEDNIEYGFNEMYNTSDVGLIDFKNNKFVELAKQSDFYYTLINNNLVFFNGGSSAIYEYNINNKSKITKEITNLLIKNVYKSDENPYVPILGLYSRKLFYAICDPKYYENKKIESICYIDVGSKKVVVLYRNIVEGFGDAARISKDTKKVIDLKEENKIIIIYDLISKTEKEIFHSANMINRIQFYYE